jgi:prepilin-type N-terminal cleavage/methylation domain-containing protein
MRHDVTGNDNGFTLVELLIVVGIIAVLGAMVTAQLIRSKASANEAAAIASLRAIAGGQVSYSQTCGNGSYATILTALGPPAPGAVGFVSPDLTSGAVVVKSGFEVTVGASISGNPGFPDCNGVATTDAFYASARPLSLNVTGTRSFAVTAEGTIWQLAGNVPPAEPFGAPAVPIN